MSDPIIVRFAPSPTGWLHVGNVRTALANFLFAKAQGGKFMLRIDDTDRARSTAEYEAGLKEDLAWLGLEWDLLEKQSDRFDRYDLARTKLIADGRLYPCYETAEEIDVKRKMLISRGLPPIYDRSGLHESAEKRAQYEAEGRRPHWRFKLDAKPIVWDDMIRGKVEFDGSKLSDPVMFREDGVVLFTFATSVDDGELGITHIIRGEDHVSNTAMQVQIMEAMGHKIPVFGHMALLKMKEGKISKRVGGGDIRSLREGGIFPIVLASYLAKIGTSDSIDLGESMTALAQSFSTDKLGRAMANYDPNELERLNQKLLHQLPFADVAPQLAARGMAQIDEPFWEQIKPNLTTIDDTRDWWDVLFQPITPVIEDKEFAAAAAALLPEGAWGNDSWDNLVNAVKEKTGRKGKELFMPLRLALTGREHGPEMKVVFALLGRDRAEKRLRGEGGVTIQLSNTLSRSVETLAPIDPNNIRMYVCGPTVYARPHIGNARSIVAYDVLYRLLQHDYPKVTYVRNITDVDDKINVAAVERKITIQELTQEITAQFHGDMGALNCLPPTIEPRATEHIAQMIALIASLIEKGFAYAAQGHVMFRVQKDAQYGQLSRRTVKDMIAGARVEVAPYKEYPGDFVLWKPASEKDDASSKFESPWGVGRPGWHIECSAMAGEHLGVDFDIHGGGADLMFPHHENEIAQSTCAHPGSHYAKLWVHNGFLTVNGEKMSKSLGNFITVHDLLSKGIKGEAIRFALMSTRYNEPLDWSQKLLDDSQKVLDRLYRLAAPVGEGEVHAEILDVLRDNLNTPKALAILQTLEGVALKRAANFLGLLQFTSEQWFQGDTSDILWIEVQIDARAEAKKAKDFAKADGIRALLKEKGILLEDTAEGTIWRKG